MANTAIDASISTAFDQSTSPGAANRETNQKLAREASLIGGGIAQGLWARTEEFAQNPIANALTVGATTAATWAAGYAAMRFLPSVVPAAKYVLVAAALVETIPGLSESASAAVETWSNPDSYARNKDLIADNMGKPLFDLALYSAAGAGGFLRGRVDGKTAAALADSLELQATRRSPTKYIPFMTEGEGAGDRASIKQIRLAKNPELAEVYGSNAASVVQVLHPGPVGKGGAATGFVVDDGLIATNNHVLHGRLPTMIKLSSGETVQAKLVARDKAADLALLQLPQGVVTPRPLQLGSTAGLESGSQVYMIGHPQMVSRPVASAGRLSGSHGMKFVHAKTGVPDSGANREKYFEWTAYGGQRALREAPYRTEPQLIVRRAVLSHEAPAKAGSSGSPLFDRSGKVVGIHSTGGEYRWGSTVEHLKALIGAYKADPLPTGWLNVITHATPRTTPLGTVFGHVYERVSTASVDVLSKRKFVP